MPLTPGTRLGVYQVHRAARRGWDGGSLSGDRHDAEASSRHKILPSSLSADPDRLARFQREAEVLASLNHPNIAAIYGLQDAQGVKALVMELVEGVDPCGPHRARAIPIDDALPIAKQIVEALEATHEHGIIHGPETKKRTSCHSQERFPEQRRARLEAPETNA